jgi:histidinol-phosphate aminotransferase
MYKIYSMTVGATPVAVPEKDLRTNVDNILKAVGPRTRIVFIANPNNPTGSYIGKDEIIRLRNGLPDNVLLVLDGAYAEYVSQSDYTNGKDIVDLGENTVMTRTFSKIYGLAALRIGWAYCPPSIADILNRVRGPFNVSSAAIAAASAAVKDVEFTEKARLYNDKALKYMNEQLANIGLKTVPSVGNFLLAEFPQGEAQAHAAYEHLMKDGIIVRPVANYGLAKYLRISIGLEEDNAEVIKSLKAFLKI